MGLGVGAAAHGTSKRRARAYAADATVESSREQKSHGAKRVRARAETRGLSHHVCRGLLLRDAPEASRVRPDQIRPDQTLFRLGFTKDNSSSLEPLWSLASGVRGC